MLGHFREVLTPHAATRLVSAKGITSDDVLDLTMCCSSNEREVHLGDAALNAVAGDGSCRRERISRQELPAITIK